MMIPIYFSGRVSVLCDSSYAHTNDQQFKSADASTKTLKSVYHMLYVSCVVSTKRLGSQSNVALLHLNGISWSSCYANTVILGGIHALNIEYIGLQ